MALPDPVIRTALAVHQDVARAALAEEFEALYREHSRDLESFVYQHVRDRGLAEDLVQETFIRAYRAWPTIDKDRPFGPWLRTVAMRLCIDTWRAQTSGRVFTLDVEAKADALPAKEADPAETLAASASHNGIGDALDSLSARHRRILVMKDSFGMRYEEIAKVEGTTLAAIRCSLSVARRRFREKYLELTEERGFGALIFLPFLRGFRGAKRLAMRLAHAMHRTNVGSSVESIVAQPALQVSSGIVAIAVVLGTIPFSGHIRPPSAAAAERGEHPTFTFGAEPILGASPAAAHGKYIPLAASGVRASGRTTTDASGAFVGAGDDGTGAAQGDAPRSEPGTDPTQVPTVDPNGLPKPPDNVVQAPVDEEPPVEPGYVTDPNANVEGPEDSHVSSFAATSDGQTIFAAGRNQECAARPECPSVLFRSTDGGASWSRLAASGFDGREILLPPGYGADDSRVFAMSYAGVLEVSTNGGQSFAPAVVGSPTVAGGSMAISPAFDRGDSRIVIGGQSSLFEYRDQTGTITPSPYLAAPGELQPAFATRGLLMVGGRALDDNGQWRSAVFRCEGVVCTPSTFDDRTAPNLRLASDFADSGRMYAFTQTSLFFSSDGGASFAHRATPWGDGALTDLALAGGQGLLAAVRDATTPGADGVYSSADGGLTWVKLTNSSFDGGVVTLVMKGSRVVAGLEQGGVACSSDGGSTWASRC